MMHDYFVKYLPSYTLILVNIVAST